MKFYPADWRSDAMLRLCSISARGLWAEMMCIMHDAERYGSLLVNGRRIDKKQLASLAGISEKECCALLLELEGNGVFSRDEDGTIYSRRMRRDHEKAIKDSKNGGKGGNPNLKAEVNLGVNPPDNGGDKAQKPEARSQIERAEPIGSDAVASRDYRAELFGRGLKTLSTISGKGPDACRAFVGKCLKAASDDAIVVLGLIEDAERNRVANPTAWIAAHLKPAGNFDGKVESLSTVARRQADQGISFGERPTAGLRVVESSSNVRLLPQIGSERP